jgi:hypothetical protein
LPDPTDPGQPEASRRLLKRSLDGLGVAMANEMNDYFRLIPAEQPREALKSLLADEEIVEVKVEGWPKPGYVLPEALDDLPTAPAHRPTFLAPFDNVMWERKRVERIFGFHYRVEIYVPEPKRQYGYYVMPLLAHGTLCGRADLKLDRAESVLRVRGLWLEGAEPEEAQQAVESRAPPPGGRAGDRPR